jgi:hypothetical protein
MLYFNNKVSGIFAFTPNNRVDIGGIKANKFLNWLPEHGYLTTFFELPTSQKTVFNNKNEIVIPMEKILVSIVLREKFIYNRVLKALNEIFSTYKYRKIILDNLKYISSYVSRYLSSIIFFRKYFKKHKPKIIFTVCHYCTINKGIIKVANEMNIPTVDVQHGLISKTQPGYISKNSIKEDIPMYIFVYGKYFKDIILENSNWFSSNNIIVTGNYYLSKYKINEDVYNHKNNVLLITTQPIVDCKAYEKIIQEALKENLEVYIKIHPSERIEKYEMLRNKYNLKIIDKTENLYEVLKKAKYHATVFSTSAIESLFFGIPNIIIPWKNYENNLDFLVDNKTSIKYNEKLSKILKTLDKNRDKTILKGEYFFHDWDQEKADYILNQYFTTGR